MSNNMTPTPWKFDRSTHGCRGIKGGKMGKGRQGQYQAIAFTVGLSDDKRDRANAEAIEKAVNATYGNGINPEAVKDVFECLRKIQSMFSILKIDPALKIHIDAAIDEAKF